MSVDQVIATAAKPDVLAFLAARKSANAPPIEQVGVVAARAAFGQMGQAVDLPVGPLAVMQDFRIPASGGRSIKTRLFDPREQREPGPVIVFFHGGGFVLGDLDTHAAVCAEIAREADLPVVAVDYRLAPEHPWPAASEDCEVAIRWIASSPKALGRRVTGFAIAGDSAGAWLAMVTSLALQHRPASVPHLANGLLYPLLDMDCDRYPSFEQFGEGFVLTAGAMRWFVACHAAEPGNSHATLSQVDATRMPPTLVATAGLDPLRDQGRAFAAMLVQAGVTTTFVEMAGQIHGFAGLRRAIPSAAADLRRVAASLAELVSAEQSRTATGGSHKDTGARPLLCASESNDYSGDRSAVEPNSSSER